MTRRIINVINASGGIGKSLVSSLILETFRIINKENVSAYVLDNTHQGFYYRYGKKNKGALLELQYQNASSGVAHFNIRTADKANLINIFSEKDKCFIFDWPADSVDAFMEIYPDGDYIDAIKEEAEVEDFHIVSVLAYDGNDKKSYHSIQAMLAKYENTSVKFTVFVNYGKCINEKQEAELKELAGKLTNCNIIDFNLKLSPVALSVLTTNPFLECCAPPAYAEFATDGKLLTQITDKLAFKKHLPMLYEAIKTNLS